MPGPYRTPRTWVYGENPDDVIFNEHLRDQLTALQNGHLVAGGRLTPQTGIPVGETNDTTGSATLYYTPCRGNLVGLYATGPDNNANWHVLSFNEISTPIIGIVYPDGNYDVFLYAYTPLWTVGMELVGWLSATTRAVGLSWLHGVRVKSNDFTRRYVGTVRVVGGVIFDSIGKRWISNEHHRCRRPLLVTDATASWTGQSGSPEYVRNNAANQVSIVSGTGEPMIMLDARLTASNTTAQVTVGTSISENSTNTPAAECIFGVMHTPAANYNVHLAATLAKMPTLGYNAYAWLQYSQAVGTTTWLGASTNILRSGMAGWVEG